MHAHFEKFTACLREGLIHEWKQALLAPPLRFMSLNNSRLYSTHSHQSAPLAVRLYTNDKLRIIVKAQPSTRSTWPQSPSRLPYSAKFSRDKIFADRPFANFRGNKFRGSNIPADHAHLRTLRVPIYQEIVFRGSARLQRRHVQLLVSLFQLFALV